MKTKVKIVVGVAFIEARVVKEAVGELKREF